MTPPVFDVVRHDRNRVAPGYIFVAPYSTLVMGSEVTSYLTQQTGPMIYDQNGVSASDLQGRFNSTGSNRRRLRISFGAASSTSATKPVTISKPPDSMVPTT